MNENVGMILGWIVVTVVAWFLALALLGYSFANINPLTWSIEARTLHLIVQGLLIAVYGWYTRPR